MRRQFVPLGTIAIAVGLLCTTRTHAASLDYAAPESCPSVSSFEEEVERLVGEPLGSVEAVDFRVRLSGRTQGGWRAEVTVTHRGTTEGPRTRVLEADTCAQVAQAAAIAVALAAKSDESTPGDEPSEPTPMEEQGPPATARPPRPELDGTLDRRRSSGPTPSLGVGVSGLVDVGALPEPAPGVRVEGRVQFGSARVVALGAWFPRQEKLLANGTGGEFSLGLVGLLGCGMHAIGEVLLGACAGFELGWLSADGVGILRPTSDTAPWRALNLEFRGELPLGDGFRFDVTVGSTIPFARRRFVVNEDTNVHRSAGLSVRAGAGFAYWF